jgi:hypothetical protein
MANSGVLSFNWASPTVAARQYEVKSRTPFPECSAHRAPGDFYRALEAQVILKSVIIPFRT